MILDNYNDNLTLPCNVLQNTLVLLAKKKKKTNLLQWREECSGKDSGIHPHSFFQFGILTNRVADIAVKICMKNEMRRAFEITNI